MPTISTTLALAADPALRILCDQANALGAVAQRNGDCVDIQGSTVSIRAEAGAAGLGSLSPPTRQRLWPECAA